MSSRPSKGIFRKEALDQLSSPEQLDQLLEVVSRKSWIPIFGLAAAISLALIWSVVGTIPVTVEGAGQLHFLDLPLSPLPAPAAGRITTLRLTVGDVVKKGEKLGEIDQPELRQRWNQENVRLTALERRNSELRPLREKRWEDQKRLIKENRKRLNKRIVSTREQADREKEKSGEYLIELEKSLAQSISERAELGKLLRERHTQVQELEKSGQSHKGEILEAKLNVIASDVKLSELKLQRQQIELSRLEAERAYTRQMDLVAELNAKIGELDVQWNKSEQLFLEFVSDSDLAIQEIKDNIARYKEQHSTEGQIKSMHAGRVHEVAGLVGQFVAEGRSLATIGRESEDHKLVAFAFFDLKDGKKIEVGDKAHITLTTVKRERDGSIIGKVLSVSDYPVTTSAVETKVGNAEVARRLTAGGDKIQVVVELNRADTRSGFEWTSGEGPGIEVSAGSNVIVRAIIEERKPISYIIPFLRELSGS